MTSATWITVGIILIALACVAWLSGPYNLG